jgi:hypothetical protein
MSDIMISTFSSSRFCFQNNTASSELIPPFIDDMKGQKVVMIWPWLYSKDYKSQDLNFCSESLTVLISHSEATFIFSILQREIKVQG